MRDRYYLVLRHTREWKRGKQVGSTCNTVGAIRVQPGMSPDVIAKICFANSATSELVLVPCETQADIVDAKAKILERVIAWENLELDWLLAEDENCKGR